MIEGSAFAPLVLATIMQCLRGLRMFIKRNSQGQLIDASPIIRGDISEFMADDDTELQDFFASTENQQQIALERSDQAMARVLEDVIILLVEGGAIRFTDLPEAAQSKLLSRRELRSTRQGMDLLDDGDDLNI